MRASFGIATQIMSASIVELPLFISHSSPNREVIMAQPTLESNCFRVVSIPAFVYGLAPGDTIHVTAQEGGYFEVVKRSGYITIRVFVNGSLERHTIRDLIENVTALQGVHSIGSNNANPLSTSLLLLSLHMRHGFPKIESLLEAAEGSDVQWEYGNVYDANGHLLSWLTGM